MVGRSDDERTGVVRFSFEAATGRGVPTAWRADLLAVLGAFHCERPDDVVLVASELVSNGAEHGGGVRRLRVDGRRGVVTIEVEDSRAALSRPPDAASRPEGGRGLRIIDDLSDRWGWWPTHSGKTVWATFLPVTDT